MGSDKWGIVSPELVVDTIMNDSQDTIYFKDKESRFLISSKAHARQFGVEDSMELIGKRDQDYFPEEFAKKAMIDEEEIIKTGIPKIGVLERWERTDGEDVWFSASKYPFYDKEGNIIGTWGTSKDVSDLKKTQEELARVNIQLEQANIMLQMLSDIDGLSGLYNQRYFYETIEKAICHYEKKRKENEKKSFCLTLLDIDYFKEINDTYGHLIGDCAIQHVANLLTTNSRPIDVCFRYGGDEFAILIFEMSCLEAKKIAERIRAIIETTPFRVGNEEISITASIGIAEYYDEEDIQRFIQRADDNLYKSKNAGRNKTT